jgi:hypothetical protein
LSINLEDVNLERLRNVLDEVCSQIAERFNLYGSNGKPLKATIIDAIANSTCIACIANKLSRQTTVTDVDALYRECHRLAVNMLVEELYNLLSRLGYTVVVTSETRIEYGKVDVIITMTNYGINLRSNTKELMVEVKTGVSLSLSQLFRYLLHKRGDTIVVWRIRRRQVLVFDVQDFEPLLIEFMKMCIMRGSRLLSSPEPPQCQHTQRLDWHPTQEELQNMFQDFAKAVTETLPYILKAIFERLEIKMELPSRVKT